MKTKKIRIALVINSEGEWAANGWDDMENWDDSGIELSDDFATARHWIEVEVPVPAPWEPTAIIGKASEVKPEAA